MRNPLRNLKALSFDSDLVADNSDEPRMTAAEALDFGATETLLPLVHHRDRQDVADHIARQTSLSARSLREVA